MNMRKIRITITGIWAVAQKDYKMAEDLVKEPDVDTAIDYIIDSKAGDNSVSDIKAEFSVIEE